VSSRRSGRKGRRDADHATHQRVVEALAAASRAQDRDGVRGLLDGTATLWVDATGSDEATPGVVEGADETARALCRVLRPGEGTDVVVRSVNGVAGLVVRHHGRVTGVVSVAVRSGRVATAWAVLSPAKLRAWNRGDQGPGVAATGGDTAV